jgi:hypothetical protein
VPADRRIPVARRLPRHMDNLGVHDVDVDAEAVAGVTLRRYSRRMVEALAQSHIELALRLRAMVAAKLRDARRQMILLGRKTSARRRPKKTGSLNYP